MTMDEEKKMSSEVPDDIFKDVKYYLVGSIPKRVSFQ